MIVNSQILQRPGFFNWISRRWLCALFGHSILQASTFKCDCGASILQKDSVTRIRHVVSCFLFGHTYRHTAKRCRHNEYACIVCGHPLLFKGSIDPYRYKKQFLKRVRYACNLFGHAVHQVTRFDEFMEYACHCGHTFLRRNVNLVFINHPLICLFAGHFIYPARTSNKHSEFICKNCGHTFLFPNR